MATYTLTGPSTGLAQAASTNFTVTMDATAISGSVNVTLNDSGAGGTFTPTVLNFTAANQAKTFTYIPAHTGPVSIAGTNDKTYVNPAVVAYTATINYQYVLNQILWAQDQSRGGFFFYELQRVGGLNDADVRAIRDAYLTYKTTRSNRPAFTPAHQDTGTTIHGITSPGGQVPGAWR